MSGTRPVRGPVPYSAQVPWRTRPHHRSPARPHPRGAGRPVHRVRRDRTRRPARGRRPDRDRRRRQRPRRLPRRGRSRRPRPVAREAVVVELNTPGGSARRDAADHEHVPRRRRSRSSCGSRPRAGGRRAPARSSRLRRTSRYMAPGTNIGAATPVEQQRRGHPGRPRRQGPQRRDREHHGDRGGTRSPRRLGGVHRRGGEELPGERGGRRRVRSTGIAETHRRRARARPTARRCSSTGRPTVLELTDAVTTEASMNPLQALLHLLSDPNIAFVLFTIGLYGLHLRAPEPELRHRHPRRARDHPRVRRLRQPPAQLRGAAAARASAWCCSSSRRRS